jgi:hypothetical protein
MGRLQEGAERALFISPFKVNQPFQSESGKELNGRIGVPD